MPNFTDSPYEKEMKKRPMPDKENKQTKRKEEIRSPCFFCAYNRNPCVGYCLKELLKEGDKS